MSRTLLVIPHYRDSDRLRPFLRELIAGLPARFSILVSEDGSGEEEASCLRALLKEASATAPAEGPELLPPLMHQPNTGKGGAVIRGWDQGREGFSLLAFADADGAVGVSEILRAEARMREPDAPQALFGSRIKMLGRTIRRSLRRHLAGRVFATLVSMAAGVPAYDTQCGLKILTPEAFRAVRPFLQSRGFAFDVELLLLLRKKGFSVHEFPVDWEDVSGSKVSLLRDSVRMAAEVFRIRHRIARLGA